MTRRQQRTPKQPRDFRTASFKGLKGFSAAGRPEKGPGDVPGNPETGENDEVLFRRAMDGAKPLRRADAPDEAPVRRTVPEAGQQEAPTEERLFLEAMRSLGTDSLGDSAAGSDDREEQGPRSPSSRMRRLRRGSLRIGAELDLHGFVKDEALRRLEHFLTSAAARGLDAVLVITGKGTNSPDGPVLQGAVAAWLRGPGLRFSAEFHPAPRDRGGSGAFVVFLRRG